MPYVKAIIISCFFTLLPNSRAHSTIFAPMGNQWVILELTCIFLFPFSSLLWIDIALMFKSMFFNLGEHNFHGLVPDDLSSLTPLAGCPKLSRAKLNLLPSLNVLDSFALETLLKLNFWKYFFNSIWLSRFPFSPYISCDVDPDVITKIPNGSGFSKIDVYSYLKW